MPTTQADLIEPPRTPISDDLLLPLAVIIIISIAAYLLLIVVLLLFRKCLMSQGFQPCCTAKDYECNCCLYCKMCAETCNCAAPSLDGCLNYVCPTKQKCLNCSERCTGFMNTNMGLHCDSWNCKGPDCDTINCFCCQVSFKTIPQGPPPDT